jgi:hypothetical protein
MLLRRLTLFGALGIDDWAYLMHSGRIVLKGPPADFSNRLDDIRSTHRTSREDAA